MSITNELKKYALGWDEGNLVRHDLLVIADHIDVKYQKMLDEHDSERFNALMDARDKGVNAVLKEPEGFGLIALPKDADDKYIHIGDVMESKGSKLLFDEAPFEVWAMQYDDIGWKVYDHLGNCYSPSLLRRHAQTVENVQEEQLKALAIIEEFLEENVKLRKMVQALHYCTSNGECNGCPINSDGTAYLMPDDICNIMLDCMRELGVD